MQKFISIIFMSLVFVSCGGQPDLNEVAKENVVPYVHKMMMYDSSNVLVGTGTGFDVEFKGKVYTLTNKHICQQYMAIETSNQGAGGGIYMYQTFQVQKENGEKLKILKISQDHDLCLLETKAEKGLKIARQDIELHDSVTVVGHPRGLPLTVRHGTMTASMNDIMPWVKGTPIHYNLLSVVAYGGNSGSPITNKYGEVIGVLFAGFREFNTETFAVPLTDLKVFFIQFSMGR